MDLGDTLKRVLVGRKLASDQRGTSPLSKRVAFPVFGSDALSSIAYSPDQILMVLSLAGMAALGWSWPIGLVVAILLIVVVLAYRQTVLQYPSGGGDYEVARTNLGESAGLVVAAALLVDYVLTVAVSLSAAAQHLSLLLPALVGREALVAAVAVGVGMLANLRGVRESHPVFALPTYLFLTSVLVMMLFGLVRVFVLAQPLTAPTAGMTAVAAPGYELFGGWVAAALVARALASGASTLTGIETLTNGVPAYQEPKGANASRVIGLTGVISVILLGGVLTLASLSGLKLPGPGVRLEFDGQPVLGVQPTVLGQLAATVFDTFPAGFFVVVIATIAILLVAANTAFNGFSVLGSVLARDSLLPRALYTRGDRLAYSNGIVLLGLSAVALILVANASVTALLPLYIVAVFTTFALGQAGMVRHWTHHLAAERDPAARRRMHRARAISAVGCVLTGAVLVAVLATSLSVGPTLTAAAMALLFVLMRAIRGHYGRVRSEVALDTAEVVTLPSRVQAVIFITELNRPAIRAVNFARATRPNKIEAVTVASDDEQVARLRAAWEEHQLDVPLKILASPYREVVAPFLKHVRGLRSGNPRDLVCVYIPEYIVGHWWERLLHNQTTVLIKARLDFMNGVMVTSVPFHLASSRRALARVQRNDAAWRRGGTGRVRAGLHIDEGR